MTQRIKLCSIRKEFTYGDVDIPDELVKREIESDVNRLNNLLAKDLAERDTPSPALKTSTAGSESLNFTKTFYFMDVEVVQDGYSVKVVFSDGHEEKLSNSEVVSEYQSLKPSDYGPKLSGEYTNPSTGTVHLVNTNNNLVCGRNDPDPSDVEPIDTVNNTYRDYCSQCSYSYDRLITKAADLSIPLS